VIDNAAMWLEHYHLDGLRLDAVHAIVDESAVHLLEDLALAVDALARRLGRSLWLIAESDRNDPRLVRPHQAGGYGLDATWSDDFHHALHATLTGERTGYYQDFGGLSHVAKALERVYVYGRDYSPFRDRHHGRPAGDLPGTRFVGYLQNHDQIGNRAVGERSSALMSVGRLKVAAALVLLAPFVPMLFQGEEWGASTPFRYFTDHHDPALGRAVRDGRRREFAAFGWDPEDVPDPQAVDTWRVSVLDWAERARDPHAGLLEWHRALVALRTATPDLSTGDRTAVRAEYDERLGWLRVTRGRIVLVANLGAEGRAVAVADIGAVLLVSDDAIRANEGGVHLPPDSVAIVARGADAP
jgi:maltooligosyltrehalose trehalohydrolase